MAEETSEVKPRTINVVPKEEPSFECMSGLVSNVSGEWLLTRCKYPNGGTVIVLRALYVATLVYWPLLGFKHWCEVGSFIGPHVTCLAFGQYVAPTIPWYGALFAAAYATLQTRFSSQWTYLADVYNRIKEAATNEGVDMKAMAEWMAGFIEDAEDLHLIGKPMFRSVFQAWSKKDGVKENFVEHTHNGAARWDALIGRYGEKARVPVDKRPGDSPGVRVQEQSASEGEASSDAARAPGRAGGGTEK